MRTSTPRSHAIAAVTLLLLVNLFIFLFMVIAPSDSAPAEAARAYKLTNLGIAGVALIIAVWRGWYVFLTILALLQIASLFWFLPYVNSLPM